MSKELQTLILAYKVVFLDHEQAEFGKTYEACDPERLMKLATSHAVRPVLYQALKKIGRNDLLTHKLQLFASQMALRDKLYGIEMVRILKLFREEGIEVLPYKGYLFTKKLYGGQHFRESGDMDMVIRDKERVAEAIALLKEEGYELHAPCSGHELVNHAPGREVSLMKENNSGLSFHIDFHWGVNETYHIYPITTEDFFKGATIQFFLDEEILIPSNEAFFKMLLNHHGGRGGWLKLKELFDLSLFLSRQEGNKEDLKNWASAIQMDKVFQTGNQLNGILVKQEPPAASKEGRAIIKLWEREKSYDNDLWLKIKKMRVYLDLQNPDISRLNLFRRYAAYHGTDTPLYEKYYRPFDGRSRVLNFIVKMGTIFYRGIIGRTYK